MNIDDMINKYKEQIADNKKMIEAYEERAKGSLPHSLEYHHCYQKVHEYTMINLMIEEFIFNLGLVKIRIDG